MANNERNEMNDNQFIHARQQTAEHNTTSQDGARMRYINKARYYIRFCNYCCSKKYTITLSVDPQRKENFQLAGSTTRLATARISIPVVNYGETLVQTPR